jgi:single-strand DNA-binding protein
MNKIMLIGRVTKDLELKQTTSGKSVCEFNIAVNRDKDNADFPMIQVWNSQAENLTKYQGRGSLVGITGELRTDNYTDKEGNKKQKVYVLANNIEYLERKTTQEATQESTKEEDPYKSYGEQVNITNDFLD